MLSSSLSKQNLISKEKINDHNILKYEFQPIKSTAKPLPDVVQIDAGQIEPSSDGEGGMQGQPLDPNNRILQPTLEKELIDKLLEKTDELSTSLAKLQLQFENQAKELDEKTRQAREDGYTEGFGAGKESASSELSADIDKQRQSLAESLVTLNGALKSAEAHIEDLEKELSAIAVDIAREVVVKEVSTDSQAVASELTKELLGSIKDATNIVVSVNPLDFEAVSNACSESDKIEVKADNAITRGGVIISSDKGKIDGNIMTRYKNLKQQVLENLEI